MRLSTLFAALPLLLPVAAMAQDDAIQDAVKGRQGYFTMLSIDMGTLAGMAKGDIAYDEAAAVAAATNIQALTQYNLPPLFVEGSSTEQLGRATGAKPNIWTDAAGFSEKYAALRDAAADLPASVAGGQGNVGPALGKVGGTCKACHDDFRQN